MKQIMCLVSFLIPLIAFPQWTLEKGGFELRGTESALENVYEYNYIPSIDDVYDTIEISFNSSVLDSFSPMPGGSMIISPFGEMLSNGEYSKPYISISMVSDYAYDEYSTPLSYINIQGFLVDGAPLYDDYGSLYYKTTQIPDFFCMYDNDFNSLTFKVQKKEDFLYTFSFTVDEIEIFSFEQYVNCNSYDLFFGNLYSYEFPDSIDPNTDINLKIYNSQIPEPSEYALFFGFFAIIFTVINRKIAH